MLNVTKNVKKLFVCGSCNIWEKLFLYWNVELIFVFKSVKEKKDYVEISFSMFMIIYKTNIGGKLHETKRHR